MPLSTLYSFFSFTVYSNTCMSVLVYMYMLVYMCVCACECVSQRCAVLLWLQVFRVSLLQDALSCRRHDIIDICWIKQTDVPLFNILVYIAPTHTHAYTQKQKKKKKKVYSSLFSMLYSLTGKLINVHVKLNHYTLLNTFLWYLLNDHLSLLLSK